MKVPDSALAARAAAMGSPEFLELIAARKVIAATKALVGRPEVKMAAMMAPALKDQIKALTDALAAYDKV
jgi:hypothetical protein